tara:strand:- start:641 stop:1012 length:372 start_codon:yes stop_codon:yes gene_type:complete
MSTVIGTLLVRHVNMKAIEHLLITLEQVGLSWIKVHPHSISQESDGGRRLNNSLRMVHPVVQRTSQRTFEKMVVSGHISGSKVKGKEEDADERLLQDVVSSSEVYLERLTLKSSENSSESMVT